MHAEAGTAPLCAAAPAESKVRLSWYARVMTIIIGKRVCVDTVAAAMKAVRLSIKKPLVVYSEALTDVVYQSQQQFKARPLAPPSRCRAARPWCRRSRRPRRALAASEEHQGHHGRVRRLA